MYIEDKNIFISAVLTMHNEELYLEQCIDSILDQDHDNFELIIIDDGSTDRSCEIHIMIKESSCITMSKIILNH